MAADRSETLISEDFGKPMTHNERASAEAFQIGCEVGLVIKYLYLSE